jgi:hypothetical protein
MASARDLRRIAMSLEGTVEAPHFDRVAFKVARIYATLAADRLTANLKFTPDEQELKCLVAPEVFSPIPNAWGKQGWTTARLAAARVPELRRALEMAWRHALPAGRSKRHSFKRAAEPKHAAAGNDLDRANEPGRSAQRKVRPPNTRRAKPAKTGAPTAKGRP